MSEKCPFDFCYRITYSNGQTYDRPHKLNVEIRRDAVRKIIEGYTKGIPISEVEGIDDAIKEMTEQVRFVDRWFNLNGTMREKPLKKERNIDEIEFSLPESVYNRLSRMQDPLESFDRAPQKMELHTCDGEVVTISEEFGEVTITDFRHKGSIRKMDTEAFLNYILR